MNVLDMAVARLEAAAGLPDVLAAAHAAFAVMLPVIEERQDPGGAFFATYVIAGATAATGRLALVAAPPVTPPTGKRAHGRRITPASSAPGSGETRPMSDRAVFGDFARVVRSHLAALAPGPGDSTQLHPASVASQIREYGPDLSRVLRVMSRYTCDIAAAAHREPGFGKEIAAGPWRLAALQARTTMQDACLRSPFRPAGQPGQNPVRKTSTATRHLAAAADAMTIGRDLLQTHFTTRSGRAPRPCSEWSAMVTSASGRRALLAELGDWASEIAAHTEYLTVTPTLPGQETAAGQQRLAAVRRDLIAVAEAAGTARAAEPVSEADVRQLSGLTMADLPEVRGALNQVTSALVAIAAAEYTRTRTAARKGRLLTPAGPGSPDHHSQSFARVSRDQATALLSTYRDAGAATAQASTTFTAVASTFHSYRAIHGATQPRPPRPPYIPPDRRMDPALPAAIAAGRGGGKMPGPVECRLVQLGVTDTDFLSRGAALDQAARELIDQAAQHTASQRWNTAVAGRNPTASTREIIDHILARDQRRPAVPAAPVARERVPELQAEP